MRPVNTLVRSAPLALYSRGSSSAAHDRRKPSAVTSETKRCSTSGSASGWGKVRDGKVTHFTGQSELQRVRMLLGVTDPHNKAIKVARHGAPGQAEVMWAQR
ncbi:hypothetical protein EYF80_028524 [Liparis tanakae]|uniref:Uncharacterized protein n=1 Tax=Liparis tanakae TaxID=230148 RepID=A0A4Z2H5Z9_9TELE|nr:hypothetical protein EYF80_028524 [Liparis tanakae]